ncbi:SDR family NAD(P)-dependent oxidoreductase [Sphingopyxis macrogoltabida]|uniref:Short-chain dehydrogenase n=1 Tax=Sphingopyxis macrogoltabida TaxID=33050 RepID=A0AAC8YZB5_SPHMC|nr:SDR family oxidoreductase [Sphingopyxis macrogoltabida]ALJ13592.1 short-chain dehydrogenase [Sphingopyxis macrogoltabida]AMU88964.1 short-chain dehydrogenase [Sphingopyxis macrogoltabida]
MDLFSLEGKVALVTGSSRGIGRAIAEAYVDAGARVVISSRNQTACDEVADAINARSGGNRALAVAASISSKFALEEMISAVRSHWGAIDILVCNAASNPFYGPMAAISDEQFRKVFENNVLANHWLASMVSPDMARAGGGAIVIVSSIGGFVGSDTIGAYNISKAADMQLVRNLAVELGGQGIRINAIAPGVIRTDFAKALYENPETEAALRRATPLGRIGEPADIAGAAVFLASRASGHVTGQTIIIDGGVLVRGGGL